MSKSEAISSLRIEAWLQAMMSVAAHYRMDCSEESVRLATAWVDRVSEEEVLERMARQLGLAIKFDLAAVDRQSAWRLPLLLQMQNGQVGVLKAISKDGVAAVAYDSDLGLIDQVGLDELRDQTARVVILRPAKALRDVRVDSYIKAYEPSWFRDIVLTDLRPYGHVMLASLVANTLALAGIVFSMQVYDRVIPSESYPTLYVLFIGVLIAVVFDFIMRKTRMTIVDLLGKRADLRVSDRVFGHALRVKNSARPASTGTFIAQLRELEQVRELMTSTTVTAIADMPFFLLFTLVFWYIAGPLILIPIAALIVMVAPGFFIQGRLRKCANEAMRESSLRNAMLVEAIQGAEDLKVLQAESRFQTQWNYYNAITADAGLRLRSLVNTLTVWTQNVQTTVFAVVVCLGAPIVMEGDMTTGALVAASILASRMMSPMANVTQVLSRWQQAKIALQSLNQIMQLPTDIPAGEKRIHRPFIKGDFQFRNAIFQYGVDVSLPVLHIKGLEIKAGERVAILGKNGAGKSTLLQAMSGLLEPVQGVVELDDLTLAHIDPADVRRDVSLLSQGARLFHGTLRENLMLGSPQITDMDIMHALRATGADAYVRRLSRGLDHMLMEGGIGLSGGQRQALLLARLLLRKPQVVLLDEPTSSMDEYTERKFIDYLSQWGPDRTIVLATHRLRLLDLADRVIVIDNGLIVLDDVKSKVMQKLAPRSTISVSNGRGRHVAV